MDSLSQIVLGAAVGEAILGKKIGRQAALWGAIAGTIPDLDVFASKFLPYIDALAFHRGFTHSMIFALLCSILLSPIANFFYKKKFNTIFMDWFLLFFWGLFTHALLDCHTTWGTQLFWPSEFRLSLSAIFVVDPLYTLPFLTLLVVALFYNKDSRIRRRLNYTGLTISCLYLLSALGLKNSVHHKFEANLKDNNIAYSQIEIRPTPFNTLLWTANIETEKSFLIGHYSILDSIIQPKYTSYPKKHYLLNKYTENEELQKILKIMKGNFIVQHKGKDLLLSDLRFGKMYFGEDNSPFVFNTLLEISNNKIQAIKEANPTREKERINNSLSLLWNRIKGN